MKKFGKWMAFLLFFVFLGIALPLISMVFTRTDAVSAVIIREMQEADDIELAMVGSSVVEYQMDPEVITRETGLKTFDVTVVSAGLQMLRAVTENMYVKNNPKLVVLCMEPDILNAVKESPEANYKGGPFLKGLGTRLRYYLDTAGDDHQYLERLIRMRGFGVENLEDVSKTIAFHLNAKEAFSKIEEEMPDGAVYRGRGYVAHQTGTEEGEASIRQMLYRDENDVDWAPMYDNCKRRILEFRDLVESRGSRFLVLICPQHAARVLSQPSFLSYCENLQKFCQENHMDCINLQMATPQLLPELDGYYYDPFHLNEEGAALFSEVVGKVLDTYLKGGDMTGWFFPSRWEYLDSIDRVTNTWLFPVNDSEEYDEEYDEEYGAGEYVAGCNAGLDVEAEYRFVLVTPGGDEYTLQDYSEENTYQFEVPEECQLRVYARPVGGEQDPRVFYDYPGDYNAFAKQHPAGW